MRDRTHATRTKGRAVAVVLAVCGTLVGCGSEHASRGQPDGTPSVQAGRTGDSFASAQAFQTLSFEMSLPFESQEALGKRASELGMKGGPLIWTISDEYGETSVSVPSGWSRNYVDLTLFFTPKEKVELNPGIIEALGRAFEIESLRDANELIFKRVEKGTEASDPGIVTNEEAVAVGLPRGVWLRTMRFAHWSRRPQPRP